MNWTTVGAIKDRVRRRWDDGSLLRAYAAKESFPRIDVSLRGPRASEIGERFAQAQDWALALEAGSHKGTRYTLEFTTVGGRLIGRNSLPSRAIVDAYEQAWALLGVAAEVAAFDRILTVSADEPVIRTWVGDHPLKPLPLAQEWGKIIAAYLWLDAHRGSGSYLREITAPGVDTKFTERHRVILAQLLGVPTSPAGFVKGLGLGPKPGFVRLRPGAELGLLPPVSELALRHDELSQLDLRIRRAVIVENEITYLSVPVPSEGIVIWGKGFDVDRAGSLPWLRDVDVIYWGDLDTYGFAILNRLRARIPQTRSVLMDRETLLAHRDRWVTEESPTAARLDRLTSAESQLYSELVQDQFGSKVRLEQEVINWSWAEPRIR